MNITIDIETIPTQRQAVCNYIEESMRDELQQTIDAVCAPTNYKDADKIAEFCTNKRAALQTEFPDKLKASIDKTGLDGAFGQVCCIGWAVDDGSVSTVYDLDERHVLGEFARLLTVPAHERHTTCVIGHNVSAFDLRFLTQRYIVNSIRPPMVIARAAQAKPWESEKVFDTMVQWAGVGQRISLDKLCLALSVPSPKGEIDGSQVWRYVQDGRIAEVAAYCARDVNAARSVWRRMTFAEVPTYAEQLEDVPA